MPSSYRLPRAGRMASNFDSWNSAVRPSFLAIAVPRSTSKPTILPPCLNSLGSYDGSVPKTSLPSLEILLSTCPASASSFWTESTLNVEDADPDGWAAGPESESSLFAQPAAASAVATAAATYTRRSFTSGLLSERDAGTLGHVPVESQH